MGADGKPAGNIGTVTINFGMKDSSQNIPVTHNIVKSYEYKDVTETINITAPEGGDFVDNQTKEHKSSEIIPVKLQVARLVTTDEFTGEVTPAGDWKANTVDDSTKQLLTEFPERSLLTFKGYTPQTDKGTITDGKLSSFPLIKNGQPVQDFLVQIPRLLQLHVQLLPLPATHQTSALMVNHLLPVHLLTSLLTVKLYQMDNRSMPKAKFWMLRVK